MSWEYMINNCGVVTGIMVLGEDGKIIKEFPSISEFKTWLQSEGLRSRL